MVNPMFRRIWLLEQTSKPCDDFEHTQEFYETIMILWKDGPQQNQPLSTFAKSDLFLDFF